MENRRERTAKLLDALGSAGTPVGRLRKLEHARLGGRVPHHVVVEEILAAALPHLLSRWEAFWAGDCEIRRPDQLRIEKPGRPGQYRTVYSFRPLDRIFLGMLHLDLAEHVEPTISDIAVGGRPGRGLLSMVKEIQEALRAPGAAHAVLDVQACFDSIPHDRLEEILAKEFPEWAAPTMALLRRLGPKGVGQGSPLGPLLANLFLDRLVDRRSSAAFMRRWIDDYVLIGDRESLETAVEDLRGLIRSAGLAVSPKTPGLVGTGPLAALGLLITADHVTISKEKAYAIEELVDLTRSPLDHERVAAVLRYYEQVMDDESFRVTLGQAQERHQEKLGRLLEKQYPDFENQTDLLRIHYEGRGQEVQEIWAGEMHEWFSSFLSADETDGSATADIADGVSVADINTAAGLVDLALRDTRSRCDDEALAASSVGRLDWWNDPDIGEWLKEIEEKTRSEARPSEAVAGDRDPVEADDASRVPPADHGVEIEVEENDDADEIQEVPYALSVPEVEAVVRTRTSEAGNAGDTNLLCSVGMAEAADDAADTWVDDHESEGSSRTGTHLATATPTSPNSPTSSRSTTNCVPTHPATCAPTQNIPRIGAAATGAQRRDVKRPSKESPLPRWCNVSSVISSRLDRAREDEPDTDTRRLLRPRAAPSPAEPGWGVS